MRRRDWVKKKGLTFLVFIVGMAIFLFPNMSNIVSEFYQAKMIWSYKLQQQELSEQEKELELKRKQQYNKSLQESSVVYTDPFESILDQGAISNVESFSEEEALVHELGSPLGHIEIPRIGVDIPIFEGTHDRILQRAVGLLEGSSLPVGGVGTHAALTGHRGLPSAELFTQLPELQEGDVFYIHSLGGTLAYEVGKIATVLPHETDSLKIVEGQDLVTLITCTPYMVNTHRLLITGTRIPYEEPQPASVSRKMIQYAVEQEGNPWKYGGIGAVVVVMLLVVAFKRGRADENR